MVFVTYLGVMEYTSAFMGIPADLCMVHCL